MNGQTWLEHLGVSLQEWLKNSEYTPDSLSLALNVNKRIVLRVMKGEYFVAEKSDPNFYAKLFRLTGLPEADPRTIPPERSGRLRAWSKDRLDSWWKMYYPEDFSNQIPLAAPENIPNHWVEFFYKELSDVTAGTVEDRERFYVRNHMILSEIIQLLQVLNQRKPEREESLRLMEVIAK